MYMAAQLLSVWRHETNKATYVQKWAKEETVLKGKTNLETCSGTAVVGHQSGEGAQHLLLDVT